MSKVRRYEQNVTACEVWKGKERIPKCLIRNCKIKLLNESVEYLPSLQHNIYKCNGQVQSSLSREFWMMIHARLQNLYK